jgi:hypothetical protein
MPSMTTRPIATGRHWLIVGIAAFLAGVAAIITVIAAGDSFLDQVRAACNYPPPAAQPEMPAYALPLAVVSTVLMAAAAGCGVLGRRTGTLAKLLIPLGILGALFCAWFGIDAVLSHMADTPVHCAG